MDLATVALFFAFLCAPPAAAAATATTGRLFGYPDDDHVIITQYGPMRYRPVTADEMNRPYDDGAGGDSARTSPPPPSPRGYYKAEVIPLDMKTWKPTPGGDGWIGTGAVGGAAAAGALGRRPDVMDVPLRVGYSVRPAEGPARRRRHDFYLPERKPPPLPPWFGPHGHPSARPSSDLWTF